MTAPRPTAQRKQAGYTATPSVCVVFVSWEGCTILLQGTNGSCSLVLTCDRGQRQGFWLWLGDLQGGTMTGVGRDYRIPH